MTEYDHILAQAIVDSWDVCDVYEYAYRHMAEEVDRMGREEFTRNWIEYGCDDCPEALEHTNKGTD